MLQPVQQQTVDRWSNVLSSTDPRNAAWVTSYRYDDGNRLLQMQQPEVDTWSEQGVKSVDEPVTTYRYDVRGNLIATTNALDHSAAAGAVPLAAALSVVGTGIEYAAFNYSGDATTVGKVTPRDFAVDARLDLQKAIVAGASGAAVGAAVGSIVPVAGTAIGAAVGFAFAATAAAGIEGLYSLAGSRNYFKGR